MASKRLKRAVLSIAPSDQVKFLDVARLAPLHLPSQEPTSEDGDLGDWGCADETALRLEIFQFLRNLEARGPQGHILH